MMPPGQHGQFYGQWPQQPYMADQIPNFHGYQQDRIHQGSRGDLQYHESMAGPRLGNPFAPQYLPSHEDLSRGSTISKTKKPPSKVKSATTRQKAFHESDGLLNIETIETIKGIKDEIGYLERDLALTFKNYKKIVPFYKLPKPPKEVELASNKSIKPQIQTEPTAIPKGEPKKGNKYIQNFFEKYEPEPTMMQGSSGRSNKVEPTQDFNSTLPKPSKPDVKAVPKPKKTSQDLYRKQPGASIDSLTYDDPSRARDQYQTLTMDQEGLNFDSHLNSLHNSQVSRASTGSKRRESFENFKRQYFNDTSVKPSLVPPQAVAKKFTR